MIRDDAPILYEYEGDGGACKLKEIATDKDLRAALRNSNDNKLVVHV